MEGCKLLQTSVPRYVMKMGVSLAALIVRELSIDDGNFGRKIMQSICHGHARAQTDFPPN